LHVVTQGFSPRTRSDGQMVRFGAQEGRIDASGRRGSVRCRVRVGLSSSQGKRAELDGQRLSAAEELRRELPTLVFTPARLAALAALSPGFATVAQELGLGGGSLSYEGGPADEAALEAALKRDLERGTTGLGPHLHDVCIRADERDLRSFGSQGEQRVTVLA